MDGGAQARRDGRARMRDGRGGRVRGGVWVSWQDVVLMLLDGFVLGAMAGLLWLA